MGSIIGILIGGDEFVVLLEREDYENRNELLSQITSISEANVVTDDDIVIAAGMGIFKAGCTFHDFFREADRNMYAHKGHLKELRPSHNLR